MSKKILIVGAGITGSTIARQLAEAEKDYRITIIDQRNHIAGNCYDYINEVGIRMNEYGAHLFHTNNERVWTFVNRFAEWIDWKHKVLGKINNIHFPIPVNIDTVNLLCETHIQNEEEMKMWLEEHTIIPPDGKGNPRNSKEVALSRVGSKLYELIFKEYTWKQWEKYPDELHSSVLERIPVRINTDPYYFSDIYQALPKNGYTEFVKSMLEHSNITIHLNTSYEHSMRKDYDFVFYTGPIDHYYSSVGYPKLEYRSIHFEKETLPIKTFQPNSVVNYPSLSVPFTRIVEYKHFLNQEISGEYTTIVKEYTTSSGEPYYPVPTEKNQNLYKQYQELAEKDEKEGIYFVGRLANYKYYNMDAAILSALEMSDSFLEKQSLNI
jgi:UDP-galactopyranose mutase